MGNLLERKCANCLVWMSGYPFAWMGQWGTKGFGQAHTVIRMPFPANEVLQYWVVANVLKVASEGVSMGSDASKATRLFLNHQDPPGVHQPNVSNLSEAGNECSLCCRREVNRRAIIPRHDERPGDESLGSSHLRWSILFIMKVGGTNHVQGISINPKGVRNVIDISVNHGL